MEDAARPPARVRERGRAALSDGLRGLPSTRERLGTAREARRKLGEGGGARLEAKVAVDRELAKLVELAEAGFEGPRVGGFSDRYIESVAGVKGQCEGSVVAGRDCSEEELRERMALGVGKPGLKPAWIPESPPVLEVKARRASELLEELRERLRGRGEPLLLEALREVAGLLAVARYTRVNAFIFAHGT